MGLKAADGGWELGMVPSRSCSSREENIARMQGRERVRNIQTSPSLQFPVAVTHWSNSTRIQGQGSLDSTVFWNQHSMLHRRVGNGGEYV